MPTPATSAHLPRRQRPRDNGEVIGAGTQGSGRFVLETRLGSGGMGVVHAALDRRRGMRVALKTLKHFDAEHLFRFKHEFRALADLVHPNLVTLHELVSIDGEWAFTMELIEGSDFLRHVRPLPQGVPLDHNACTPDVELEEGMATRSLRPQSMDSNSARVSPALPRVLGPLSFVRLREAMAQLAQGVLFLHVAGKLHRDIKPSNILVTHEGRVVLCDFGLVTEFGHRDPLESTGKSDGSGTPEYMSPEQLEGGALTEASDWYAVGTLLYHCLTGSPPFRGSVDRIAQLKREETPPSPSTIAPKTPPDLEALCLALLQRDPASRPSGVEVLRRLGVEPSGALVRNLVTPFVGREGALRTLHDAFAEVRRGTPRAVLIHSSSGMGKSALANHFLEEVRSQERGLVLSSRCYERESVPYKAVDGLVDALVVHLLSRPETELGAPLPGDIAALVRLFPVLRQLPLLSDLPKSMDAVDSADMRRRAFEALRQLCLVLARSTPLVLFIDDLQWGDLDSAALLAHLLRGPDAPSLFFIGCYRTEEGEASPLVQRLLQRDDPAGGAVEQLPLAPLTPEEGRALVTSILGEESAQRSLGELTDEAQGNPYLLDELARFESVRPERTAAAPGDRLDELIRARLGALSPSARRLLDVVAIAGGPVPREVAAAAAGVGAQEVAALAMLRAGRLLRVRTLGENEALEPYHDRIRETSRASTPVPRRWELHRGLAVAYEQAGGEEWEQLFEHWLGAEEPRRAAPYAAYAAARALQALAFDRAINLFRTARELTPGPAVELRSQLGDALAAAGHGADAAAEYMLAADHASDRQAFSLRRRATQQLLYCGRVDDGLVMLRTLLEAQGERLPLTPREAFFALMRDRLVLALRGVRHRSRRRPPDPKLLDKVELYGCVEGLSFVDPILAAAFHSRGLVLSLRTGNRLEAARGIADEAVNISCLGWSKRRRVEELLRDAEALAEGVEETHIRTQLMAARGLSLHLLGEWRSGERLLTQAAEVSRHSPSGNRWLQASCSLFGLLGLVHLGEFRELRRRLPAVFQQALDNGDVYLETSLRVTVAYSVALAGGDSAKARAELREADWRWSQKGFHVQHYHRMNSEVKVDLCEDNPRDAYRRAQELTRCAHRAYMDRLDLVRIFGGHIQALAALALARKAPQEKGALTKDALQQARTIERTGAPWALGIARLLQAGSAAVLGDVDRARTLIEASVPLLEAGDMPLYAAGARYRLGELLGGDAGRSERERALEWMKAHEVTDPQRFVVTLAPVLGD